MNAAAIDRSIPARGVRAGSDPTSGRAFIVVLVFLPILVAAMQLLPTTIALAVSVPAWLVIPWVWQRPVRGIYLLFGAALLLEVFPLNFPDSLTDRVQFFLNFSNSNSSLQGITTTPFEVLLGSIVAIWLTSSVAHKRSLELPRGPIVTAYAIYAVVVLAAEVRGLSSGGSFLTSLWELRPQTYALVMFVMASSLVRTRDELIRLAAILIGVIAAKGLMADYRYLVTLHGDYSGVEALMAHEESYFFALYLVGSLAIALWCRRRWILISVISFAPAVALGLMVNQRRAGVAALVVGLAVLLVLGIRFDSHKRRALIIFTVVGLAGFVAFLVIFWNHQTGLVGELVRPFHSFYEPDPRDFLSNQYRQAEDLNLLLTIRSSPIFGIGFGLPMLYIYPMADISKQYPLWNIIPHNTVLWIGMRMGAVGLASFFGLLAMVILQATRQARRGDGFLRAIAIFAITAIAMELVVGYVDLQLENYRNLIFLGTLLAVVQRLPRMAGVSRVVRMEDSTETEALRFEPASTAGRLA